ncbi:hypothetical protein KIN20_033446 [Parelaphostrongylus tenuis]|uniref:Uncharacterized protein n=1 Tax=Parelaphostrongylus tenuis TaxID=148309 RepID=A0AAD5R8F4_PARTN|nr:hypothetical protein KIN20_033446 [Parelaphostrongylus tenuis]
MLLRTSERDLKMSAVSSLHNFELHLSLPMVTQMVHNLRAQVLPQRFEDLRHKVVQMARAAPSCHQPQQLFGTTALFGGTTSLFGFITLFRITHIKDLNFVLLSVTRDKLAEDTVTQTKAEPVAT